VLIVINPIQAILVNIYTTCSKGIPVLRVFSLYGFLENYWSISLSVMDKLPNSTTSSIFDMHHGFFSFQGWKLAPKTYSDESEIRIITRGEQKKDENDCYPLEAAKERLLQLELNVERRYLKPPLSKA